MSWHLLGEQNRGWHSTSSVQLEKGKVAHHVWSVRCKVDQEGRGCMFREDWKRTETQITVGPEGYIYCRIKTHLVRSGKAESGLKWWSAMNEFMLLKDHSGCMRIPDWRSSRLAEEDPLQECCSRTFEIDSWAGGIFMLRGKEMSQMPW